MWPALQFQWTWGSIQSAPARWAGVQGRHRRRRHRCNSGCSRRSTALACGYLQQRPLTWRAGLGVARSGAGLGEVRAASLEESLGSARTEAKCRQVGGLWSAAEARARRLREPEPEFRRAGSGVPVPRPPEWAVQARGLRGTGASGAPLQLLSRWRARRMRAGLKCCLALSTTCSGHTRGLAVLDQHCSNRWALTSRRLRLAATAVHAVVVARSHRCHSPRQRQPRIIARLRPQLPQGALNAERRVRGLHARQHL